MLWGTLWGTVEHYGALWGTAASPQEQEAKARLRAELRTLRRSNRRLQREHEDAAARLRRVTQLLHEDPPASPPDTPPGTPPP